MDILHWTNSKLDEVKKLFRREVYWKQKLRNPFLGANFFVEIRNVDGLGRLSMSITDGDSLINMTLSSNEARSAANILLSAADACDRGPLGTEKQS